MEQINPINKVTLKDKMKSYTRHPGSLILLLLVLTAAALTVVTLLFLVGYILISGIPYLKPSLFALHYNSDNVSMLPAIINTVEMVVVSLLFSVPFGVGAAIYMIEYARKGTNSWRLSADRGDADRYSFHYLWSVRYAVFQHCTALALFHALRSGDARHHGAADNYENHGGGAFMCAGFLQRGKLRTGRRKTADNFKIVLPAAIPGILSGIILSIGRIVGETAALIYTAGTVTGVAGLMDSGRTLAIHMYVLSNEGLHKNEANATAVVLLVIVLLINGVSSLIAKRFEAVKE